MWHARGSGKDRSGPAAADPPAGQNQIHSPGRGEQGRGRFAAERGTERANSLSKDPMVQRVLELFEARPVQMDYGEDDPSQEN